MLTRCAPSSAGLTRALTNNRRSCHHPAMVRAAGNTGTVGCPAAKGEALIDLELAYDEITGITARRMQALRERLARYGSPGGTQKALEDLAAFEAASVHWDAGTRKSSRAYSTQRRQ